MKLLRLLFLSFIALSFNLAFAKVIEGKDYTVLTQPVAPVTPGKIELVEAFSYNCGHCASLNPILAKYVKTLPKDIAFRPIHVYWDPQFMNLIRLNEAVVSSHSEAANPYIFKAIIHDRVNLADESTLLSWLDRQTAFDGKKIKAAYKEPNNKIKAKNTSGLTATYHFDATPTLVVGGRYKVNNQALRGEADLKRILDGLITLARQDLKPIRTRANPGAKLARDANQ